MKKLLLVTVILLTMAGCSAGVGFSGPGPGVYFDTY